MTCGLGLRRGVHAPVRDAARIPVRTGGRRQRRVRVRPAVRRVVLLRRVTTVGADGGVARAVVGVFDAGVRVAAATRRCSTSARIRMPTSTHAADEQQAPVGQGRGCRGRSSSRRPSASRWRARGAGFRTFVVWPSAAEDSGRVEVRAVAPDMLVARIVAAAPPVRAPFRPGRCHDHRRRPTPSTRTPSRS